ncbi:MAG: Ig-like domain-containing protein [Gemmatimonadota bacterium]
MTTTTRDAATYSQLSTYIFAASSSAAAHRTNHRSNLRRSAAGLARRLGVFGLALFALAGCRLITTPEDGEPEVIALSPSMAQVEEGETLRLRVTDASRADSREVTGISVTWESLDPAVATVQDGVVRGEHFGEARIRARLETGKVAETTIEVTRTPAEIQLVAGNPQVAEVGEVLPNPIEARVVSRAGRPIPGAEVRFHVRQGAGSTSPVVAVADEDGVVRGVWTLGHVAGEQLLELEARNANGVSLEAKAEARPGPAQEVVVQPSQVSLREGASVSLSSMVTDRYGNVLGEYAVAWGSSSPEVARVSEGGVVTGVTEGRADVEAVPVQDGPSAAPSNVLAQLAAAPGKGRGNSTIEVSDPDSGGDEGSDGVGSVSVTGGDDQSGIVVTQLGRPLEIRVLDASGTPVRQFDVSWVVVKGNGQVSEASTRTDGQGRASVSWTLGPVVGEQVVEARVGSHGTATFTATAVAGAVDVVQVTPGSAEVDVGGSTTFAARALDRYGNEVTGKGVTWSVEDASVASVSSNGVAQGTSAGTTRVVASVEGVKGTADLQVVAQAQEGGDEPTDDGGDVGDDADATNPGQVSDLDVVGASSTSVTLRFTEVDDGTGAPASYQVRYHVHPIGWGWGQATPAGEGSCLEPIRGEEVGAALTCVVEGLEDGVKYDFQLVAYRVGSDGRRVFGSLSNVATGETGGDSLAPDAVKSVTVSPSTVDFVALEEEATLIAQALDADGNLVSGASFLWQSSDSEVVTVNSAGTLVARGIGTALVVVTAACCDAATADTVSVHVTQEVTGVQVEPGSLTLEEGNTRQLSAVARDSNGFEVAGATFSWSSSDTGVASVSSGGVLQAKTQGSASVTARVNEVGGASAVTVQGAGEGSSGGTSADRPNEPEGFSPWLDHDFSCVPGTECTVASGTGHFSSHGPGGNYSIIQDPSFPGTGQDVLRIRYPQGLPDGSSPGRFFGHDKAGGASVSTALAEWYVALWVKLDGPGWEVPPNELKLWYNGLGDRSRASRGGKVSLAHGGNTNSVTDAFGRLRVSTRANDSSVAENFTSSSADFTVGEWHLVEFYGKASTPGKSDGAVRIYLNGKQVLSQSNIQNQDEPGWDVGFFEFHWSPVWGGSCGDGCPKLRDDTIRLGSLYVSGKPQ